jgi:hypothetical protein
LGSITGVSSKSVGLTPGGMIIKGVAEGEFEGLVVRKRAVLILSDLFILNPHFAALLSTILTMPLVLPSPFLLSLLTDAAAPGLMSMDLMTVMMVWTLEREGSARVTRPSFFQAFIIIIIIIILRLCLLVNLSFRINFSPSGQCLFMFNWL